MREYEQHLSFSCRSTVVSHQFLAHLVKKEQLVLFCRFVQKILVEAVSIEFAWSKL